MESLNQFNRGMSKDINPLNTPKGSYIDAQNIRLVNDAETTSMSLNNILGNEYKISIPDSPLVQKITINSETAGQFITISGQTGAAFNTTGYTGLDLYDYIVNDPAYTLCVQNVGASAPTYNIYYNSNYIIVIPINPAAPIWITVTAALTPNPSYVPLQTGLEIIGSTSIRDDIYLFTTNNKTKNPGGHSNLNLATDPSSVGQIWKLTYNKVTEVVDPLTLIYTGYLDFSTYYAIVPSACLGRYENEAIQRLYWTDNFNRLRSLNVADPQVLAYDPSILNIIPSVDFDIPILQSLKASTGNDLKVGVIQCAYRLKNTGGSITTFSELSNVVTLVTPNEANQQYGVGFVFYIGAPVGTPVSKQITWQIDNLDRDFDRIEVAILFRDSLTGTPVIELLDDAPIVSDSYTVVYDGTQASTPLTLIEFLALSGSFTHCKTIETKDNRLFAANVRNQFSDLDYDSRVYRFNNTSEFQIVNNGVLDPVLYTSADYSLIADNSDAINPSNLALADPNYVAGYIYKDDGITLGGSGPNISYEFYTTAISCDKEYAVGTNFDVPNFTPPPWRSTNTRYEQNLINIDVPSATNQGTNVLQQYPTFPINDGFKYPQYSGLYRGYQRNEIYRFGILFKDKAGNPFFVKWIGDIKMPDFGDTNVNSFYEDRSATGITDFRPSFTANKIGYLEAFVQSLGIRFTVSIPTNISDLISGYEIVRLDRTENDKTIVSVGYNTQMEINGTQGYMTSLQLSPGGNGISGFGTTNNAAGFFVTPNLCDGTLTVPDTTMTMTVRGILDIANTTLSVDLGGTDPYYLYKMYDWVSTPVQGPYTIDQITLIPFASATTDGVLGITVNNYDYDNITPNTGQSQSLGNMAYYYRLNSSINFGPLGVSIYSKYLTSIERTLTNQYGGSTYTARSNNIYMSCSMIRPIRTDQLGVPDTFEVFGGDIFMNMYDSARWTKAWSIRPSAPNKRFGVLMCPLESPINTDLRMGQPNGVYVNHDLYAIPYENPGNNFVEVYTYNNIYSAQNNIKQYFPKPDPFILNEEFDIRFHASEIKINGELTDSWGNFLPNNYWDVEGSYGPINAITAMGPDMYFWQDRAFGTMSINPRVMVTDTGTDAQIQLGVGSVLQRHDYISIEVGLQHQWGMTKSSQKLYWMDISKKKFFDYSKGQLIQESDTKGMLSWFNTYLKNNINAIDKPVFEDTQIGVNGIRAVYDYKYNQAIFTFTDGIFEPEEEIVLQDKYTLIYDDFIQSFSTFTSYTPKVYITDFHRIFSTDPASLSDIYMHDSGSYGDFYGTVYPTSVKLIVNDNYQYTKIFDNIMYDSQSLLYDPTYDNYQNENNNTWETIRVYNDYQNTDFQTISLLGNLKRKERTWQLAIPRNRVLYTGGNSPNIFNPAELSPTNKTIGERMRDKYIAIDLSYNNSSNRLLTCNNFRTLYRISAR